jgi:Leucine-rich repeat (LRR) protein
LAKFTLQVIAKGFFAYAMVPNSWKKRRLMRLVAIVCFAVVLSSIFIAQSTLQSSAQSASNLNLQFPSELSVGRLILLKPDWNGVAQSATGTPLAAARGSVKTLAGQSIMLLSNDCISEHMNLLGSFPPNALACLVLNNTSITDKDLIFVKHLTGLRRLELEDTDITDVGLEQLSKLSSLEYLRLSNTLVRGNTFGYLAATNLKNLHLDNLALGARAFREVSKFKELRWLNLSRVHLTDSALAELAQLPKLYGLIIPNNHTLTDIGLRKLVGMKQLRRLDLSSTGVTLGGVLALKGIPLKWLKLSPSFKSEQGSALLHRAFPRAEIEFDKDRQRIPSEMFAPLH